MYSVVIPVYQAKRDLERCVRSWLVQTEKDLELILVDDGSTDGSAVLCDRLAKQDQRVKVLHQKNAGVSAARNAGMEAAEGEFLLFTDSDDYVAADYLEKMGQLQRESDSDLVLCGFHHIYDGADIRKIPGETRVCRIGDFAEDFLALYEKSYLNMPWNKLFRRSRIGRFDTSLSLGEDLLFNLEYMRKCSRIAVLAEPLCYYIQEESRVTLSSRKRRNRMELAARVCEETERFYKEMWGKPHEGGRIFTRYMNEVLDECGKLPADRGMSYGEKLAVIRGYAHDPLVESRGDEAVLTALDYRILWFFLKRKMTRTVYLLCILRRMAVVFVHWMRRKG
ncbi:MAG: glycosyltransferase [Clostridiales bacterium]|nr:glycosyltransferase [Clostridiales bacterium]